MVIQVKTPPDIDPSLFKRVAVVPFAGDDDEGLLAAKAVQEALEEEGSFLVEPPDTVEAALDRIDLFDATSRDDALAVARELGVDLVLMGKVRFFTRTFSDEGDVRNELYTADRATIAPFELGSSYATRNMDVQLRYTLQLTVKAVAVESGRLVRRREFEQTSSELYKQSEMSASASKQKEVFGELLSAAVEDFIYTLDTHDAAAEREVAKF